MHIVTAKLAREQFGGVMTINLAGMKAVMITELKVIKDAFVDKAEMFSDRFQHPLNGYLNGGIPGMFTLRKKGAKRVTKCPVGRTHAIEPSTLLLFLYISFHLSILFPLIECFSSSTRHSIIII